MGIIGCQRDDHKIKTFRQWTYANGFKDVSHSLNELMDFAERHLKIERNWINDGKSYRWVVNDGKK